MKTSGVSRTGLAQKQLVRSQPESAIISDEFLLKNALFTRLARKNGSQSIDWFLAPSCLGIKHDEDRLKVCMQLANKPMLQKVSASPSNYTTKRPNTRVALHCFPRSFITRFKRKNSRPPAFITRLSQNTGLCYSSLSIVVHACIQRLCVREM